MEFAKEKKRREGNTEDGQSRGDLGIGDLEIFDPNKQLKRLIHGEGRSYTWDFMFGIWMVLK